MKNLAQRVFSRPLLGSFLTTIPFFVFFLAVLRPGYIVDDDIDMIFLVSGYLGGKPVPFMVFSNVLLGSVLNPLYALHTNINWEIWLFILVNFLSAWALLYIVLSRPLKAAHKLFGVVAVLLCDACFLLNITFTTMAAFAIIAGYCLVLMAVGSQAPLNKGLLISGIALAVVGSLIRIELAPFILALILPAVVLCFRSFHIRNAIVAFVITGALIAGCYGFDRWYLRSSPDWSAYDIYNNTRSAIADTPRQENINLKYREVGWKVNDLKMFVNSFFPDQNIYSLAHLQYLVDHVSDKKKSIVGPTLFFVTRLFGPEFLPYLLLIGATWIGMWLYGLSKKALLPLSALLASFFVINLYLSWSQKSPDRILLPSLVTGVIFGLCILDWSGLNRDLPLSAAGNKVFARLGFGGIIAALIIAAALISFQSIQTTILNITKQSAYHQILSDLNTLRLKGKIDQNALIVSPSPGLPIEWANPLSIEFPEIQYLDMGWLTFSPAYEQVLREFDIQSVPAALYEKGNVYLMEKPLMAKSILRFIRENEGVRVRARVIYALPGNIHAIDPYYDQVKLYKLTQVKAGPGQ